MRVLAIETSCDETGVAVVEGEKRDAGFTFRVLGSALLSQAALHAPYGGVYPTLAKREHEKNLPIILKQALKSAENSQSKESGSLQREGAEAARGPLRSEFSALGIDAIAVTSGPGLEPALWTGITFANKLAEETGLPLIGINHMEGHLTSSLAAKEHANVLQNVATYTIADVKLPVLGLLISGGHTEFVLMRDWFDYHIVGKTLDDAVGEAFDKVARLLELPYPGGPEISKLADAHRRGEFSQSREPGLRLPRPMLQSKNCDMSFSGLKTAALYALRDKQLSEGEKAAFAAEFEDAVGDVFDAKTRAALTETETKTFVIGGGVAANRYLRERLQAMVLDEFPDIVMRLPDLSITGDNAIMIAEAALVRILKEGMPAEHPEIRAIGNLSL